jgi:hypothetical protein
MRMMRKEKESARRKFLVSAFNWLLFVVCSYVVLYILFLILFFVLAGQMTPLIPDN